LTEWWQFEAFQDAGEKQYHESKRCVYLVCSRRRVSRVKKTQVFLQSGSNRSNNHKFHGLKRMFQGLNLARMWIRCGKWVTLGGIAVYRAGPLSQVVRIVSRFSRSFGVHRSLCRVASVQGSSWFSCSLGRLLGAISESR
jgi:hypothetical protein